MFFFIGLFIYTFSVAPLLLWSDASFLIISAVLLGAPIFILWNRLEMSSQAIPLLSAAALLVGATIQLFAYRTGLWFEMSSLNIQIFGGAPIETYLFSVLHILYLVLLYEYIVDDKRNSLQAKLPARTLAGLVVIYSLVLGYVYVHPVLFVKYPFVFLLLTLGTVCALLIMLKRNAPTMTVFLKAGLFSVMVFPLSLVYEWLMVASGTRFFVNINEYFYTFVWHGQNVPLEELLLLFMIPFGLIVLYELYIDDAK